MYHALALLTPKSDATVSAVVSSIKARFPAFQVNGTASAIDLLEGDWDYHLAYQSGPEVLAESEGSGRAHRWFRRRRSNVAHVRTDASKCGATRPIHSWNTLSGTSRFWMCLRAFKGVILVDPGSRPTVNR